MKKETLWHIVIVITLATGMFYAGTLYAKSVANSATNSFNSQNPQGNMRANFASRGEMPNMQGRRLNGAAAITGTIIQKDDMSITLKLADSGSAIVFFSDATDIQKTTAGTRADLTPDANVTIRGEKNEDGSYNATMIQLRPELGKTEMIKKQ
ncbi:hypothetical protein KKG71_02420 [Patescibacteria group bacterium]|nr:hypothetical protein [Patescibacteria group bacterium]